MADKKQRTVMPYKDAPDGSIFRILKERDFPTPRDGVWVKVGNSHAREFSGKKEIIPALHDIVRIVLPPKKLAVN